VWPVFTAIAAAGYSRQAVIAHTGVNQVLLCRLLGKSLASLLWLEQGYGCLNVVHADGSDYRLESLNISPI